VAGLHRTNGFGVTTLALASVLVLLSGAGVRAQVTIHPDRLNTGATTPEKVIAEVQRGAEAQRARGTLATRYGLYTMAWAKDGAEFNNLAQNSVVMATVITQTAGELPLQRVHLVTPDGAQIPLRRLNSWRSAVNPKTLAYQQLGKFREDGFYLIPARSESTLPSIALVSF
jgi:hypothetical protein